MRHAASSSSLHNAAESSSCCARECGCASVRARATVPADEVGVVARDHVRQQVLVRIGQRDVVPVLVRKVELSLRSGLRTVVQHGTRCCNMSTVLHHAVLVLARKALQLCA